MGNPVFELERIVYDPDGAGARVTAKIDGREVIGSSQNYLYLHPEYRGMVGKYKGNAAIFAVRDAVLTQFGIDVKKPEWNAEADFSEKYDPGKGDITVKLANGSHEFQATLPDKGPDSIVFAYAAAINKMLEHKQT